MTRSIDLAEATLMITSALIYFAPSLVGALTMKRGFWILLATNTALGWTLIAWVICLALAMRARS